MGQCIKVLLAIDEAHTVPQRVLDCRPGLGGLNQVCGPLLAHKGHTGLELPEYLCCDHVIFGSNPFQQTPF